MLSILDQLLYDVMANTATRTRYKNSLGQFSQIVNQRINLTRVFPRKPKSCATIKLHKL